MTVVGMAGGMVGTREAAGDSGVGVRGGFSLSPDQYVVGVHNVMLVAPWAFAEWVLPVVELGLGDGVTVLSVGTDLNLRTPKISGWHGYVGGELNVIYTDMSDVGTDIDLGLALLFGADRRLGGAWGGGNTLGLELKIGVTNNPDVKVLGTYTFGN